MTSPAPLSWGILGCARISRRGLIPGIQGSASSRLDAIASRNLSTAKAWSEEFDVPRAYGSYEEILADPKIQAVYIPLPNELHREWVEAAADAGKHVLCEKPLALDAAQAIAMSEYCKSRRVLLMEAFMWRHQPRTEALQKLVYEDDAIGPLRLIRSSFSFPIDPGDWRLDATRGGGALWDVGCYGVNTARLFARSEPDQIRVTAHVGESGVDLSMSIALQFPGDILASIDCSFEQPFRCQYELVGERGLIEIPDAYLPPESPTALLTTLNSDPLAGNSAKTLTFDGRNQYLAMVDLFARSVGEGKLVDSAEDGALQMQVLDAIRSAI